jgi:hypothetical protein
LAKGTIGAQQDKEMPDIRKINRVASLARGRAGFPSDSMGWDDIFDESSKKQNEQDSKTSCTNVQNKKID